MEKGDYYGYPTRIIESPFLRLEYLEQAGPRIVRLFAFGSKQNLFAEVPNVIIPTPYGDYRIQGGHRLWHAPEAMPRSYLPDEGLQIEELPGGGIRLVQPVEPSGIRKSMELHLAADRAAVTLNHRIENAGLWAVECAPWAITQLRVGGMAMAPQHTPSDPIEGLLPDRHLTIWPYTRLQDERLRLDDDLILVFPKKVQPALKIGVFNHQGWLGYLLDGLLFIKHFTPLPGLNYVDNGCNAEVYTDERFIELETLGPLTKLAPGQSIMHHETWELTEGVKIPTNIDGARALVKEMRLN